MIQTQTILICMEHRIVLSQQGVALFDFFIIDNDQLIVLRFYFIPSVLELKIIPIKW